MKTKTKTRTRTKTKLYLALALTGIVLAVAAKLICNDIWTHTQIGAAIGVGAGLFGFGLSKFLFSRWEEKEPALMKQNAIEAKDERNQLIRSKAQAISGEVMHWIAMAGAWVAIFLDAALWITLAFVGVFLLKTVLDIILIAYYQSRM